MNKITKKTAVAVTSLALLGLVAMPISADAKCQNENGHWGGFNVPFWSWNHNGQNNAIYRDARKAYNDALQQINKTYNDARKASRTKLNGAIKTAGNNWEAIMAAYKVYMSDMMALANQRSSAQQSALQTYFDALSNNHSNGTPTATAQSITLDENTTKAIVLAGTDPENSTLTFVVVDNPVHGDLSGTIPNLTYTPDANYNGNDSFTFRANDGTYNSPTATVSLTVNGTNQAPTATVQSVTVTKNVAKTITLAGTDPESATSTLSYALVTNPVHGILTGTLPNLTFTPATDYTGTDSFTFKVNDGTQDSTPATISITVNP